MRGPVDIRDGSGARRDRAADVLHLLRTGRAGTLGELAAATGLARSTVGARVDRLIRHGIVRASAESASQRGRPPMLLEFNPSAAVVLVAHLGVTGARVAVADLSGQVLADGDVAVPLREGPGVVLARLAARFEALLGTAERDRDEVWGVGVGLPGPVELAAAGGWDEAAIRAALTAGRGDVPVLVDHDLKLLSLGEQRACWPDTEVLLCVKVGTVIGCGIVVGGRSVRGAQSLAGEIGHTVVPGRDAPCRCGNRGCLTAVAGGGALADALTAQGVPAAHASDVARLARAGVPPAVQAVRDAGRDIGTVLAAAVNLLNPSVVALWGYLAEAEEPLFAGIRETIYQHALPAATRELRLVRARMGQNAGVQGAAIMVVDHVLSPDVLERRLAAD